MTAFTDRLSRAVDYARIAHARQVRKGTHVPYLSHVLGVAALVVEYGGNEDQAIAGLLHDTIEDHGQAHEARSEEHTSELPSLMRISYAVFCLQKTHTHKQ